MSPRSPWVTVFLKMKTCWPNRWTFWMRVIRWAISGRLCFLPIMFLMIHVANPNSPMLELELQFGDRKTLNSECPMNSKLVRTCKTRPDAMSAQNPNPLSVLMISRFMDWSGKDRTVRSSSPRKRGAANVTLLKPYRNRRSLKTRNSTRSSENGRH